jgi:hypothetical protein
MKRDPHDVRQLPPLGARLAAGRPVMTKEQLLSLGHRILRMTTLDGVNVNVEHTARVVTRMANDRVLSSDDGDILRIGLAMGIYPTFVELRTNQLDDTALLAGVQQCEALLRGFPWIGSETWVKHETRLQETPVSVRLWHDATVAAMTTTRGTVVPEILEMVNGAQLRAAGFLGLMARAEAIVLKQDGVLFSHEETDGEITVTARSRDGRRSGWGGQTARDWSTIEYMSAAQQAITMATLCGAPVAVEPGRRIAVLAPTAIVQIFRYLGNQFAARPTDEGRTALSKAPPPKGGNKLRQQVLDSRLTMSSDPADPDGGYRPYFDFGQEHATPPMTWVKDGILVNMAYDPAYAMDRGKSYAQNPYSLRMSGGSTTVEQMIAACQEGIYVNRFSDVRMVHRESALVTGVTRDGCFLIKDGKITKAVKNFRFLESPFFFLNNIEALGVPKRAAFGYTPPTRGEGIRTWPRPPIVVPPMMVRDFNFSALSDAI